MSDFVLHAGDSSQVPSSSSFEVLLGDPTLTLIILSGVASPELNVDDDSNIYRDQVFVKFGINVSAIQTAVTQVGLASISNGESSFVFAADSGRLEVDPATGELQLVVQTAISGEDTGLSRFSYQVVANITKVGSRIAGTIRVPRTVRDLSHLVDLEFSPSPAFLASELMALFRVTANRIEPIPAGPGGFATEKLIPIATGKFVSVKCGPEECFISYVIDGCPFNIPLKVECEVTSALHGLTAAQVAGPRPVTLTNLVLAVSGVDFSIIITKVP